MKRFQFSLQAVLTMRQQQEKEAFTAYQSSMLATQTARTRLQFIINELNRLLQSGDFEQTAASDRAQFRDYIAVVDAKRREQQKAVRTWEAKGQKAFVTWVAARHRREVVEKLREEQMRKHSAETSYRQQRLMDDLAGARKGWLLHDMANEGLL